MLRLIRPIPLDNNILLLADTKDDLQNQHIGNFIANSGLYNLIRSHMGSREIPTYIQGKQTIDWILETKDIINTITKVGITKFLHHIHSDHRGLYVDLAIKLMFSGHLNPTASCLPRQLQTKQKKETLYYLMKATELIADYDIAHRLQ
eukprot:11871720-Ditylum_brightwellii.AAC.1